MVYSHCIARSDVGNVFVRTKYQYLFRTLYHDNPFKDSMPYLLVGMLSFTITPDTQTMALHRGCLQGIEKSLFSIKKPTDRTCLTLTLCTQEVYFRPFFFGIFLTKVGKIDTRTSFNRFSFAQKGLKWTVELKGWVWAKSVKPTPRFTSSLSKLSR